MYETDVLVLGSGIAGLSYALQLARLRPDLRITIVTKDRLQVSSTSFAQGGIAAVTDFANDSYENHIRDTLEAGDGLCDREVVEFVVREATARVSELFRWGVRFDTNKSGNLDLAREGGHSARRILHAADCTGTEIVQRLIAKTLSTEQITILEDHFATDLIVQENECRGAWVLPPRNKSAIQVNARITLIATGGLGQVFRHTTNPAVATGDGIVMAWRAGAAIADMEFIQFHPTALWQRNPGTSFLISEAVRGEGAVLRNARGERFMKKYDVRWELATRDVVARAVQNEMRREKSDHVYLDCTGIPKKTFETHFPAILKRCRHSGLDPQIEFIPVTPSAHYCCGGIVTDHYARTTIKYLFAAGESARTGLHGANRLASNSLLEALVFAKRAALRSAEEIDAIVSSAKTTNRHLAATKSTADYQEQLRELRSRMSAASIIIREEPLQDATLLIDSLKENFDRENCRSLSTGTATYGNLLDAAWLIVNAWNSRQTNCGAFYRSAETALA